MLEPPEIVEYVGRALAVEGPLAGRRVLITAGPTRESIDPVRYVGNRSSGRMGFALARAAWRRGADVEMVTGPASLDDPTGVTVARVETAREMLDRVQEGIPDADVVVFAAAVSDFRPETVWNEKLKRREQGGELRITLGENPDIARETVELRRPDAVVVGFALESEELIGNALRKLEEKSFSFVVANRASEDDSGFESETNRVSIVSPSGEVEELPLLHKEEVAEGILDRVEGLLEAGG
jgi:phosphopantothenoylcysteine decarboxylase/phosphopantothenate--cysteine ligase